MRKLSVFLILFVALPSAASDFLSAAHFFPVVSKTDGLAGTRWLTAVHIVNPQTDELTITARLSSGGSFLTEQITIAPRATLGFADFLGDIFAFEGNGALFLEASADANNQLPPEKRAFAASMRIATEAEGGGSFGQGVPSLNPIAGFIGDWTAYFPAVALWGDPGVNGFRTNVGFWNIGPGNARMVLRIVDATGQEVWSQTATAPRHDPFVMGLPRDLDLQTATLVVEPLDGWLDCAVYISVVDNITGDATFLASQLMDPETAEAIENRPAPIQHIQRDPRRLRPLFLGESE